MTALRRTLGTRRRECVRVLLSVVTAMCATACGRHDAVQPHDPTIVLDTTRGLDSAVVLLTGLSQEELDQWRRPFVRDDAWHDAFRVTVAGNDSVFVSGRYAVSDSALEFWPMFPLDRGRAYGVSIRHVKARASGRSFSAYQRIQLPPRVLKATTRVTRVLPGLAVLPENQLRLYIEFTAPMSREGGLPFVHLRNSAGDSVGNAFLPVDGDFWNADRTRYTLFLDPGRVKRGILPNEQMGRPLQQGRRYTIRVDSTWRDSRGALLAASFQYAFDVGAPDTLPIRLADWRVTPPKENSVNPLVVHFPEPLDHRLLRRAIGVETSAGSVAGQIVITDGERELWFVPAHPWPSGNYRLVVLSILEDLAGNRINRAFEADKFDRVDSTNTSPRFTIPFVVRGSGTTAYEAGTPDQSR